MPEQPEMEPVQSSTIDAIGFDGATLWIRFRGAGGGAGKTYRYEGVPRGTYEAMRSAASPGQYFHQFVKPSHAGLPVDPTY